LWAYTPVLSGGYRRADKPLAPEYDHPGTARRLAALDEIAAETGTNRNQVVLAWLTGSARRSHRSPASAPSPSSTRPRSDQRERLDRPGRRHRLDGLLRPDDRRGRGGAGRAGGRSRRSPPRIRGPDRMRRAAEAMLLPGPPRSGETSPRRLRDPLISRPRRGGGRQSTLHTLRWLRHRPRCRWWTWRRTPARRDKDQAD
jgi:hypothetical protein